ncbi:MAG: hypothetical protein K2N48_02045 [Muribaculaceae bacterium]|nr:hypothetical protein [Muribaculaceae bacterium]
MKKLLIIIDGMDDEPSAVLGGRTPRESAFMPGLDIMRNKGRTRMMTTVPYGNTPSSETAILNILGNDVEPAFSGRSWLEAIGSGVEVSPGDLCLRCNLIRTEDNVIVSHCCENLLDEEAKEIIERLNGFLDSERISFHFGKGYRNMLVIKDCRADVIADPVHELIGCDVSALDMKSKDPDLKDLLNSIMHRSREILYKSGKRVNGIALWAPGRKPSMKFNQLRGAVVAGTNLVKGIGKVCGMRIIDVIGATGDRNTDYSGKCEAALAALEDNDFVLLHIEAADEASHRRDPWLKVEILEEIDRQIISPILKCGRELEIVVQSDHATSSVTGRHLDQPVEVITYVLTIANES